MSTGSWPVLQRVLQQTNGFDTQPFLFTGIYQGVSIATQFTEAAYDRWLVERLHPRMLPTLLTWEGKCSGRRAKPAHFGCHLPLALERLARLRIRWNLHPARSPLCPDESFNISYSHRLEPPQHLKRISLLIHLLLFVSINGSEFEQLFGPFLLSFGEEGEAESGVTRLGRAKHT